LRRYPEPVRILLTGATGKLGNAVARLLAERGDEVVALVRDPAKAAELLPPGTATAVGDVTDPDSLERAADGIDAAINCMGIFEQWTKDVGIFDRVNAQGAFNVARAARLGGASRIVHTSTFDVFEAPAGGTVSEARVATKDKGTAYERSKQLAERLVLGEGRHGIEVVIVNPSAIYGPGPWAEAGLDSMLRDAVRGRLPAAPPGGMTTVWIEDAAAAHVAALDRGRPGERYIVADGFATIPEICAVAVAEAGRGRVPRRIPVAAAELLARGSEGLARVAGVKPILGRGQLHFLLWQARADSSKLRTELGIEPLDWREGIARTVRWMIETGKV